MQELLVTYQILKTVFHRLSKSLEFRKQYSAARRIWISRLHTVPHVFDILPDKQQPYTTRHSSRLLTRTHVCWTGRITLVTRGTAVHPVPTRDGVWCETTSLSCCGIPFVAAGAAVWTHCHHSARLVLARNWIFSLWPLEEREIPSKKLGCGIYPLARVNPLARVTLPRCKQVLSQSTAKWDKDGMGNLMGFGWGLVVVTNKFG